MACLGPPHGAETEGWLPTGIAGNSSICPLASVPKMAFESHAGDSLSTPSTGRHIAVFALLWQQE